MQVHKFKWLCTVCLDIFEAMCMCVIWSPGRVVVVVVVVCLWKA